MQMVFSSMHLKISILLVPRQNARVTLLWVRLMSWFVILILRNSLFHRTLMLELLIRWFWQQWS